MKKSVLLSFAILFFSTLSALGQITLTSEEFPYANYRHKVRVARLAPQQIPWIIFNAEQENFSYDLSLIIPELSGYDVYEDPDELQGGDDIDGAEYGFEYYVGNAFFANEENEIQMLGLSPNIDGPIVPSFQFDSSITFMKTPLTFPDSSSDASTTVFTAPFVRVEAEAAVNYEVNGYGKLKMPGDSTFDVLRLRRQLLFKGEQDIFGTKDSFEYELISWEYYAKGLSSTVLRAELRFTIEDDIVVDTVGVLTFYDYGIPTGQRDIFATQQELQFNTLVSPKLNFRAEEPVAVSIIGLNGQLLASMAQPTASGSIDLSALPDGIYLVHFYNEHKTITQKIVKTQ